MSKAAGRASLAEASYHDDLRELVVLAVRALHAAYGRADEHRITRAPPPRLHDRDLHLPGVGVADIVRMLGDALDEQLGEHPGPYDGVMDHSSLRDRHELLGHREPVSR